MIKELILEMFRNDPCVRGDIPEGATYSVGYSGCCYPHLGSKRSEEARKNISIGNTGTKRKLSPETIAKKRLIALENKKKSPISPSIETREKQSISMQGKNIGPRLDMIGDLNPSKRDDVKEKIRQSKLGKKRSFARRRVRNENNELVWA